jgi:hypothetical protein
MRALGTLAVLLALGLGSPVPSTAQLPTNHYERQFGTPVDVSLEDLVCMPESYVDRAVRVTGKLNMLAGTTGRDWALGDFSVQIRIVPIREIGARFDDSARTWGGREIEVSGVVSLGAHPMSQARIAVITFWSFMGPLEKRDDRPPSPEATLEELLTRQGQRDGERIRVVGQFRGSNLFGDLPSFSRWKSGDWVLKSDVFAVWVTGEKPKGKGWKLDPKLRRDTGKWLVVEGRARTVEGVVYIMADGVELTTAPSPTARAEKAPSLPPPPLKTPVIVFSLPLDGERDIPQDTVFRVQFCNDMDETSFEHRVGLRYAGRPRPGDRVLDAVTISYDMGRRALIVDPGDLLRSGRAVELILLPGIIDIDGQSLEARPDHNPGGAADVLRFQVSGTLLTGS